MISLAIPSTPIARQFKHNLHCMHLIMTKKYKRIYIPSGKKLMQKKRMRI